MRITRIRNDILRMTQKLMAPFPQENPSAWSYSFRVSRTKRSSYSYTNVWGNRWWRVFGDWGWRLALSDMYAKRGLFTFLAQSLVLLPRPLSSFPVFPSFSAC